MRTLVASLFPLERLIREALGPQTTD